MSSSSSLSNTAKGVDQAVSLSLDNDGNRRAPAQEKDLDSDDDDNENDDEEEDIVSSRAKKRARGAGRVSRSLSLALSRHQRKAVNHLSETRSSLDYDELVEAVLAFTRKHPTVRNVLTIAEGAQQIIDSPIVVNDDDTRSNTAKNTKAHEYTHTHVEIDDEDDSKAHKDEEREKEKAVTVDAIDISSPTAAVEVVEVPLQRRESNRESRKRRREREMEDTAKEEKTSTQPAVQAEKRQRDDSHAPIAIDEEDDVVCLDIEENESKQSNNHKENGSERKRKKQKQVSFTADIYEEDDDVVCLEPHNIPKTTGKAQAAEEDVVCVDVMDTDEEEVVALQTERDPPLREVLRIFPNAKSSFVQTLLEKFNFDVEYVVQEMIDKGYEKEAKPAPNKHNGGSSSSSSSSDADKANGNKNGQDLDFTSTSWETTLSYRQHAVNELINNFPFFTEGPVRRIFATAGKHHYHKTLQILSEITNEKPRNAPFTTKWSDVAQRKRVEMFLDANAEKVRETLQHPTLNVQKDLCLRNSSRSLPRCDLSPDDVLLRELAWIRRKHQEEIEAADAKVAEELNNAIAAAEGSLLECGCCCDEYPFEALIQCSEGHLFCKNCLKRYVEETVFGGGRSSIKCMSADGCEGYFPESMIKAAVPAKVFDKYNEALTRDALKAAHIDDLVNCHNCSLQVSLPEECGNILVCPSCTSETCRLCGEESHIPLKCSEVEKKGETSLRLKVEEAMTQARVRECPKCKTRFYKIEGCNKMTCTCGMIICYICRKDITKVGYNHFCQTAHCTHETCKKCKLFTNSLEDDRQAMLDAGLKTVNELKQAAETNEGSDETANVADKIDLNKLLEGGIKPQARGGVVGGRVHPGMMEPQVAQGNQGFHVQQAAQYAAQFAAQQAQFHARAHAQMQQARTRAQAHAQAGAEGRARGRR